MKQTKQQRRAARQRKRGQHHARPGESAGRDSSDAIGSAWSLAAHQRASGLPAAQCVHHLLTGPPALVDAMGAAYTSHLLVSLAGAGWTATDLDEVMRRRLDQAARDYVRAAKEAAGSIPEGLSARALRLGLSRADVLAMVVEVLAALGGLPRLGETTPVADGGADTVEDRMLAKVRALLAKAESTEFEAEADALTAKAQKMMSRYALDSALVQHDQGVAQQASVRRLWLDAPYVRAKSVLVTAVAGANRCRTVLVEHVGFVIVIGASADLRTVELLSTSLLVQATRAMLSSGSGRSRAGSNRSRSFRQSFLVSYAQRIAERLELADRTACAETEDPRLLPVLAARSRAVDDKLQELYPETGSLGISSNNGAGWAAGRAAADLARFEVGPRLDEARTG